MCFAVKSLISQVYVVFTLVWSCWLFR